MNKRLKSVCAVMISVSLMTGFFTACGKKINYNPAQGDAEITNNNMAGEVIQDEPVTGEQANTAVNGGSGSGSYSGGNSSGSYSGGSYAGGGSGYNGSGNGSGENSNVTTTTTKPTSTTTKYVFDIKAVLNNAPLNPLYTNDEELDGRIDKIFAEIMTPNMSTYDKVRAVFNYLVQTNRYGFMAPRSTMNTYLSLYDREIVVKAKTILKTKTGNCIDFACAFAAMTRRIGLNCYMIKADITNAQGVTDYHGWNIIRINGIDYAFDSQADFRNSKGGATKFTNFGIYNPDKYKVQYTNIAEKSFMNFKCISTPTTTNETDE